MTPLLRERPVAELRQAGQGEDEARAQLAASLQQIIDHPDRLALPSVRDEAVDLLQQAREQTPSGPVLQAQVEHLASFSRSSRSPCSST